jgi:tetratricopeptide (TPR) repeat protein
MDRWPWILVFGSILFCLTLGPIASATTEVEFDRATEYLERGDADAALKEYEAFLSRAPDHRLSPVAAMAVANLHLEAKNDSGAALEAIDRLLTDYRSSRLAPEAARLKGDCTRASGDWQAAGEAYRKAIELGSAAEPAESSVWINEVTLAAADCFHQAGDQAKVIETYEMVLEVEPPPEVAATAHYRLGESHEASGHPAKAAEAYTTVLTRYPSSQPFDSAMSKRELIDSHAQVDWDPLTTYARGSRLIAAGDLAGALANCDTVMNGSPNPPLKECTEYRKISLETTLAGDFTEGSRKLEEYLERYPNGLRAETARSTLEQRWGPIASLEAQAAESPEDPAILLSLGQSYLRARSASKAVETLEKATASAPDNATAHLMLGYAYASAQRNEEAIEEFNFYLERNPNDVNTLNMIGYTYLGQGDSETAIEYFRRYAEIAPDEANAHDSLGEGLLEAGMLEEAAREYERAVEIDPGFFNSYFMLGRVYRELGNEEKAAAAYRRLLELSPTGSQAEQARAALREMDQQ